MELSAIGDVARSSDPDRFEAALFEDDAPLRERFFTLIALNAELARTRLRVSEPQIGLIRLQWWRDAIEEAEAGAPPRAHELAAPVSELVSSAPAGFPAELIRLVDGWERALDPEPFASLDALRLHLEATAARMMRLGGFLALGRRPNAPEERALAGFGLADGAARALRATPALAAENRCMLPLRTASLSSLLAGEPDVEAQEAVKALAGLGLQAHAGGVDAARGLPAETQAALKPVLLASWRARGLLRRVMGQGIDLEGRFAVESPFRRRAGLLWRGIVGRF